MKIDHAEYFQAMPARLRSFFVAAPIYLAFCAIMILLSGKVAFMFFLVLICGSAVALLLFYNVLVLIGLRRPMLILTESYLTYRRVRIPWQLIRDVTTVKTPMGNRVGIKLRTDVIGLRPIEAGKIPLPGVGYLLRKSIAQYGAIIIPPARGLTTEEMWQILSRCHGRAVHAEISDN